MDGLLSADPPYISEAKGTGVPVGQKGTLQCEASAVPSAEFQWFKDDKRYVLGPPLLISIPSLPLIADRYHLISGNPLLTPNVRAMCKQAFSKLRKVQLGFQCRLQCYHVPTSEPER